MDTPRAREMETEANDIREQIQEGLAEGRYSLAELQRAVVDKSKAVAQSTDQLVHENPWSAIGVAAAIGFAIGLLLPRD